MAINSVWLLPALALALVIIFPVFATNRTHLITRWKSSKRRRLLFVRITIVTLLLATVVTLVWPVGGTTGLVQGAILSSLVLGPVLVFFILAALIRKIKGR